MDNEFLLFDRIEKIKQINEQYDLEHNAYLSFSGGKDSTVLNYLLDMVLPGNKIPRLFLNTGIEYIDMVEYVKDMQLRDNRIIIYNSGVNIFKMLEENGYPFKSKEHSKKISLLQNGSCCESVRKYSILGTYKSCPKILRDQLSPNFPIKISDRCCYELKKKPASKWAMENHKKIVMVGLRMEEGGQRANHPSCLSFSGDKIKGFKPLNPMKEDWMDWFIQKYNIKLCKLYYPPYNFERTGCKGCPFSLNLQDQLDIMERLLPNEYSQCEMIWKIPYAEMRRIGYRLRKIGSARQLNIFDFIDY